ncbi:GGDEF domain-containing protein [bacterium]|nr:GGDEF domain-containing protein [bacterium]
MIGTILAHIRECWFPGPTAAEASAFRDAVASGNICRERILAFLMICISIVLIGVDCLFLAGGHTPVGIYGVSAIIARLALMVFLAAFLLATRPRMRQSSAALRAWDAAFVMVSLCWCSLYSGALLLMRPGVDPYLMAVLTVAAFLYQGAVRAALVFAAAFLVFSLTAIVFSADSRLLISSLINGGIGAILAFVVSGVTFAAYLRNYRNDVYIAEQKRQLIESNEMLQHLSFRDPLTNVANRRFLEMTLDSEWKLHVRSRHSLSIIMIDIDWFKSFNDSYGHLAGDECLRRVAAALETSLRRSTDLVTRYGGEEFCVLLPVTDRKGAVFAGRNMMRAIHALQIPHGGSPFGRVTVSMGVAGCLPAHGRNVAELIHAADTALYNAKAEGKNRLAWHILSEKSEVSASHLLAPCSFDERVSRERGLSSPPDAGST